MILNARICHAARQSMATWVKETPNEIETVRTEWEVVLLQLVPLLSKLAGF
jgi:hypothetical protein